MDSELRLNWIRAGAMAGIAGTALYTATYMTALPSSAAVVLASLFGIGIALGCLGLHAFIAVDRRSVTADIAAGFGVAAGFTVVQSLVVQLAFGDAGAAVDTGGGGALAIAQGLNVAWEMLIAGATLLFALAILRHPRFGAAWALPGVVLAFARLAATLPTFPVSRVEAGLIDVGPFLGLWYVALSARALASLGWVRARYADPTPNAYSAPPESPTRVGAQ